MKITRTNYTAKVLIMINDQLFQKHLINIKENSKIPMIRF